MKTEQGVTLIEMLVVIVIIGILGAIALPSLLNQITKARQSEGKLYISALNRSQHMFFYELNQFTNDIDDLALGIEEGARYYTYSTRDTTIRGEKGAISKATPRRALGIFQIKGYAGAIEARLDGANDEFQVYSVLCEQNEPPSSEAGATRVPSDPVSGVQCSSDQTQVGR